MLTPSTANETDAVALQGLLAATPVGETCTYAAMTEAIGRDVRTCSYLLFRAVRRLNAENGALFASVRGVGYKRLQPSEAHLLGRTSRARIRRMSHRTSKIIARALDHANDMPDTERRKAMAEIGVMNMLAHLATEKEAVAAVADTPMPVGTLLRESLKKMGGA